MKSRTVMAIGAAIIILAAGAAAQAQCVTTGARATAATATSAKWYVMETMVQAVSWGLWPGFLATGKVAGHTIRNEKYKCITGPSGVTCRGRATFCKRR